MESSTKMPKKKIFIVPIILMLVIWVVLFLPAGSLGFWEGWIFWIGFSLITIFIAFYFMKKDPSLLARRTKHKAEGAAKKSPALFKLYYLGFILPGLDFRFQWSHEMPWLVIMSNIIVFAGYIFIVAVFRENSYASTVIRVENEQKVIKTGPYSIVRHPMYLGMVIMSLFIPLALGSFWAVIPILFIIPITVFRINAEEELLLRELKGYNEYCQQIRYRLIPRVW